MMNKHIRLGSGTSRTVYIEKPEDTTVMKIATGNDLRIRKGCAQNLNEYDIYPFATLDYDVTHIAKVHDLYNNERILIMDRAIPITKQDQLPEDAKPKIQQLKRQLKYAGLLIDQHAVANTKPDAYIYAQVHERWHDELSAFVESSLYYDLIILHQYANLSIGDLTRHSSWGYKDDHCVLIDYGATHQTLDLLY